MNPWTDPITGATVTATDSWIFIRRGTKEKAIPLHGAWSGTNEDRDIRARWKAARDE